MKKITNIIICICMGALLFCGLSGCGITGSKDSETAASGNINVISREDGSGTRGAFTELLNIIDSKGNDATTLSAEITNSTGVMLSSVIGNKNSIGYISIGSLTNKITAICVDGVSATAEHVKDKSYPISRPFILAYKSNNMTELAKDFTAYVISKEGQSLITAKGYVGANIVPVAYTESGLSGKLSIEGSTSVGPVMEILAEEYMKLNKDVTVTVTQDGSGTGITSVIDGGCEIAMSSRELTATETSKLTPVTIATDGIAVIVNNNCGVSTLTSEQIRKIFLGEITKWNELT